MGRTQLQDAVPMTLGQEFTAFGHTILEDVDRLGEAQALIREINMGATAIGTGINAPAGYAESVCRELSRITELALITAPDLVEATADTGAFVQLSGVLKRCAVKLSKICNDLRLLELRPARRIRRDQPAGDAAGIVDHAGQGESGDSRGRESGLLRRHRRRRDGDDRRRGRPAAAQRVRAGDRVSDCCSSIEMLRNGCRVLRERCVEGITANPGRMRHFVEHSIGIVTALVPVIGYEQATSVAKEALETGRGVYDVVMARGLLTREELDRVLDPEAMTGRHGHDADAPARHSRASTTTKAPRPGGVQPSRRQTSSGLLHGRVLRSGARSRAAGQALAERRRCNSAGRREGWMSGIDEAIAILKLCADDWSALAVHALYEGDRYESWDTVLTIEGPYDGVRPPRDALPRRARAPDARSARTPS